MYIQKYRKYVGMCRVLTLTIIYFSSTKMHYYTKKRKTTVVNKTMTIKGR